MIQSQILQPNITRTVWQTVRRIADEILGIKGLIRVSLQQPFLFMYNKVVAVFHVKFFPVFD